MTDRDAIISIALRIFAVLVPWWSLNGFFVAAEFALVKVRDTQLSPLIKKGQRRAKAADYILAHLDSFLSAAQLGITLASLGLGWIGEPVFTRLLEPVFGWLNIDSMRLRHVLSFTIGFSAITFLHISAGEQAPKWLAIQKPLPTALWIAYPMIWFHKVSYPLRGGAQLEFAMAAPAGRSRAGGEGEGAHSEEELRLLFAASQKARRRLGAAPHHRAQCAGSPPPGRAGVHAATAGNQCVFHRFNHCRVPGTGGERPATPVFPSPKAAILTARWGWCTSRTFTRCASKRGPAPSFHRWPRS